MTGGATLFLSMEKQGVIDKGLALAVNGIAY